jgi:FMN phosphatase YigB (HAD superfamily)
MNLTHLLANPKQRFRTACHLLQGLARLPVSLCRKEPVFNDITLVSFDIFDTLLLRHPACKDSSRSAAAFAAEKWALRSHGACNASLSPILIRHRIERQLGGALRQRQLDEEPWHGDVLRELLSLLQNAPATEAQMRSLREDALEQEWLCTQPNPKALAWIQAAKAQGLRVITISDSYLSAHELLELLHRHGVAGIDRVYSSSDAHKVKLGGRLFKEVLRQENIAAAEMLHIGDSFARDLCPASALGMRACYAPPPHCAATDKALRQEAYRLGRETLGPVLATFGHLLLLEAERRSIGKLAFLARDAHGLMQVTQILLRHLKMPRPPELAYAYLSRRAVALAAANTLDPAVIAETLVVPPAGEGIIARVLAAHDLPLAPFAPHFQRLRIEPQTTGLEDLQRLTADAECQALLRHYAAEKKRLLQGYLEQEGFWHKDLALVDIGWRGSISSALTECFGEPQAAWPSLLLGFWHDGVFDPPSRQTQKIGLLADFRRGKNLLEAAAWQLSLLLEAVCRAAHGTVLGYETSAEGSIQPVLAQNSPSRNAEISGETLAAEIMRGILDHAEHYGRAHAHKPFDTGTARRQAQKILWRLAFFPSLPASYGDRQASKPYRN